MSDTPEPVITVLVADDEEAQCLLLEAMLTSATDTQHRVTTVPDGSAALTALREQFFDVALLDISMPGLNGLEVLEMIGNDLSRPQVIFISGQGTAETAARAMKLGAYDFLEKPVDRDRLLTLVWKASAARRVQAKTERLEAVVRRASGARPISTADRGMKDVLEMVSRVASSDVSVLVMGESGTGKEMIALELHKLSERHAEPLVALNCAAVPEHLAESELFGHERGAFTGAAKRKIGLIELADGGTLFLDEIGDLSPALQAKLLRTLEERRFRRVGGVKELPVDFRLVSATNRPLQKLVDEGTFRSDLFYRINAIVLELPPLRDRGGDVGLLAHLFLAEARAGERDWTIEPEAVARLESYPWPGNVRELRNVIERAALLARDTTIRVDDLAFSIPQGLPPTQAQSTTQPQSPTGAQSQAETDAERGLPSLDLAELEALAIREALERTHWHQGKAAEALGISDRTLHRKIRSLGLRRPD